MLLQARVRVTLLLCIFMPRSSLFNTIPNAWHLAQDLWACMDGHLPVALEIVLCTCTAVLWYFLNRNLGSVFIRNIHIIYWIVGYQPYTFEAGYERLRSFRKFGFKTFDDNVVVSTFSEVRNDGATGAPQRVWGWYASRLFSDGAEFGTWYRYGQFNAIKNAYWWRSIPVPNRPFGSECKLIQLGCPYPPWPFPVW